MAESQEEFFSVMVKVAPEEELKDMVILPSSEVMSEREYSRGT